MSLRDYTPLAIWVEKHEDLALVSSFLQDSLCSVSSMHNAAHERGVFGCSVNRFCFELSKPHRVHALLRFEGVEAVHKFGFSQYDNGHRFLNFLTIEKTEQGLTLVFSANKYIKLKTNNPKFLLRDAARPWPTLHRPLHKHELLDASLSGSSVRSS